MDLLLSGVLLTIFEGFVIWAIYNRSQGERYTWIAYGRFCMFLFIAADLLWIDSPCKNGMICRNTTNQYITTCLVMALFYLVSLTLKVNRAKMAFNVMCSSSLLLIYIAFHDFCKKPDMRCLEYTKPHVILYAILLIIFAIAETVALCIFERKEKIDEPLNTDCKES